jgi:hypothetical protein
VIHRRALPAAGRSALALSLVVAGAFVLIEPLKAQTPSGDASNARNATARLPSGATPNATTKPRPVAAGERRPGVPPPTSAAQRAALPAADEAQKAAAELVYYGRYVCDHKWEIHVERHALSPGYVDVRYQKDVWVMKPVASSTGAVRLEDMKQHTLLVQIPSKSMLLNTRTGQRLVDACVGEGHLNAMRGNTPVVAAADPSSSGLLATATTSSPSSSPAQAGTELPATAEPPVTVVPVMGAASD